MTSNRQIGIRNRTKTKKWLEVQGYIVEVSEVNKICYFGGRLVAVHKDLFGSDLLAMNGNEIVFIQCKSNKDNISSAIKEFSKYPFPASVQKWVICWELRARTPIIRKL